VREAGNAPGERQRRGARQKQQTQRLATQGQMANFEMKGIQPIA
jgi:hypothetical protein